MAKAARRAVLGAAPLLPGIECATKSALDASAIWRTSWHTSDQDSLCQSAGQQTRWSSGPLGMHTRPMPTLSTLAVFAVASLALAVVPGPAVLYIVTRSVDQGRTAGVVSTLGIATGGLVHVVAAAVGLSALVMSSASAYAVVKWAGVLYLIWIGVQKLRERDGDVSGIVAPPAVSLRRVFWQGALVNVLNPKTALFFLALLPQFVEVSRGAVPLQVVVLGCVFVLVALASDSTYAVAAAAVGRRVRSSRGFARRRRLVTGGSYLTLGLAAAFAGGRAEAASTP
jgi:threonine/homoserine/homoserine lactone efflux protein